MNKNSLMVFLVVVASIVGYLAFNSVNKEIKYNNEVAMVNEMVIGRLDTLRKMQLMYRDINGGFAKNFDELFGFMQNGKYFKLKQVGEVDGEVFNAKIDTLYIHPIQELFGANPDGFNIQKYKLVPPSDTAVFKINAGTILQNNVTVPVFEIEDPYPFSKVGKALRVGDMNNAVTSGNWK